MLAPISRRTAPGSDESWARVVSLLTNGLVERGVDVTLFATADSETKARLKAVCPRATAEDATLDPKAWEPLHVSQVFEQASEFDLIHNHGGMLPLTYSGLVRAPILTTIHEELSDKTLPVYQKYHGRAYYVAARETGRRPELDYIATIDHESREEPSSHDRLVSEYLRVYERILEKERAKRVDAAYDRRPWGEYWVLQDEETYKVKRIDVLPGQRLSYQKHFRRSEHWFVVQGTAKVTLDGKDVIVKAGEPIDVPVGTAHRLENVGEDILTFIEVQHGSYFGEDDIVRLQDDYGRTPP